MRYTGLVLRSETKRGEQRTPLLPEMAEKLLRHGLRVLVESSPHRVIPDEQYRISGCTIVPPGYWKELGRDGLVLGLKELETEAGSMGPFISDHCYFAHCFKGQAGSEDLLSRFDQGGGKIFDLEFLCDENEKRIAAFGYWAGFAGAALAMQAWCMQQIGPSEIHKKVEARSSEEWVRLMRELFDRARPPLGGGPKVLVTGAHGRSGRGAFEFFSRIGIQATGWDLKETQRGGPFPEILDFDMLVHCVGVKNIARPFLTRELIDRSRRLSVVSDVTCDTGSPQHLLPFYEMLTSLESPVRRIRYGSDVLDVIAIDHLPTLLPLESSREFSLQLFPYLEAFLLETDDPSLLHPWNYSLGLFKEASV